MISLWSAHSLTTHFSHQWMIFYQLFNQNQNQFRILPFLLSHGFLSVLLCHYSTAQRTFLPSALHRCCPTAETLGQIIFRIIANTVSPSTRCGWPDRYLRPSLSDWDITLFPASFSTHTSQPTWQLRCERLIKYVIPHFLCLIMYLNIV